MLKFLLAALLALPAAAQEAGQWNQATFLGLNDAVSPALLGFESSDLLNTESNLDGSAILKRKGFAKTADLTVSTGPVNGSHSFIDSSGNRLDIVCQDRNCAKSTNGNAFSTFLTTAATGITRWSFVDVGGILYGGNSKFDPILKYDGTTLSYPSGMPKGSILELTQDRLAVGDIQTLPNRIHYSSAGAYEQFTVGVNPEDSFFDEIGSAGDRIRGVRCVGGNCFIFKTASITLCEMADQYNTQCSVISPNIGTTDPASIVTAGSSLYFRAQDKNYWEIDRGGLRQISQKIPNLVKSQSGGLGGGENTNTQTTKADWDAGVQNPLGSFDVATINGAIFPSSVTLVDTSSGDFAGGTLVNVTTESIVGSVVLSSTVYEDTWGGDPVAGRLGWSALTGSWQIAAFSGDNYVTGRSQGGSLNNILETSSVTISSGSWSVTHQADGSLSNCSSGGAAACFEIRFMVNAGGDYYAARLNDSGGGSTKVADLIKNVSGSETILTRVTYAYPKDTDHVWGIIRSTDGRTFLSIDGVDVSSTTDVSISSSVKMQIAATFVSVLNASYGNNFDDVRAYHYKSQGSITSRIFDTTFSTPTWGQLSSTFTSQNSINGGNVAFYVQSSTANDGGGFTSLLSSSDTLRPVTLAQKRYVRYRADFTTLISTATPSLAAISLAAVTTGQFRTQCIQPNASITAWGTLSCAQTTAGIGNEVFYATSAASCASLPTTPPVNAAGVVQNGWTAQTNNATVTIATNTAVYVGWRSLLGATTDQAQVDACVLTWNEGTPSQPSWAAYDSIKNAVYWTSTINGAASTNRLLKYDRNLEQWYPFNIPAQAPRVINNDLYFGGASSGTWNKYGGVDSDAGANIYGYWTSKDAGADRPFQGKSFQTASVLSRNNGSGSLTGTWTLSNAQTGSYTISLSTGTGISYARSNYKLPFASAQQFMNLRVGNNSSTPFEVLGIGINWQVLPFRVEGP